MTAQLDRLYAKRPPDDVPPARLPSSVFLQGHLEDAYRAASEVVAASGDDQLLALGLDPPRWRERLRRVVVVAAALHDLGKANDHFQEMLSGARRVAQGLRHEWVAYYLFQQRAWMEWLTAIAESPQDARVVLWTISGHHPGYDRPSPPKDSIPGAGIEVTLLSRHSDFRASLDWIETTFGSGSPAPPAPIVIPLVSQSANAFGAIGRAIAQDSATWASLPDDEKRLVAACKACLIAADVAASALARRAHAGARGTWIRDSLACRPAAADIEALVREKLNGSPERPFQATVSNSPSRVTLVRAGCGTGKTVAAYLWAARRWPGRRVYFCYPTTGTATEGFRGYLFDEDAHRSKYGAQLFHSRADVDLEMILDAREDEHESQLRIEALLAWSTPIAVCTADTVLGLIQNQRRGLFAWPALAQSAFVFDEIHAYDGQLFGCLLRFIDALRGVPILLMTASLTAAQRAALEEALGRTGERLTEIGGAAELEQLPRYARHSSADPYETVRREFAAAGKVLWVCNTVNRAIEAADDMSVHRPVIYHSRFRYVDRVEQHKRLMATFERDGPALAVCTQVAEMSLDISATLLVTELAPVPALIQRLGRLNRRAGPPAPGESPAPPMPFVVMEPLGADGELRTNPYSTRPENYGDWPAQTRDWLDRLGDGALSQADLATAWTQSAPDDVPTPAASTWLDGGPITQVGTVRDASPGLTVLLKVDADAIKSGDVPLAKVALPMPPPRGNAWREWRRVKGIPVAPADAIDYDAERGGRWRRA